LNTFKFCMISFVCCATFSCKSTSSVHLPSAAETSILGSWEGCDGRVITFRRGPGGEILGRYSELGGLERYRFTQDEVGYRIREKTPGTYEGKVKWQNTQGSETWKTVAITIQNNEYSDNSSDPCSNYMTRIH